MDIDEKIKKLVKIEKSVPYLTRSQKKKLKLSDSDLVEMPIPSENIKKNKKIWNLTDMKKTNYTDLDKYGNIMGLIDYNSTMRGCREKSIISRYFRRLRSRSEDEDVDEYDDDDDDDDDQDTQHKNKIHYTKDEKKYLKPLTDTDKEHITKLEEELIEYRREKIPLRFHILRSDISIKNKEEIILKLDNIHKLSNSDNEYYKLKQWLFELRKIPLGTYISPLITKDDSQNDIRDYLLNLYSELNLAVYGHRKAKLEIVQSIAQQISNTEAKGVALGLCGPMGNGKTSLIKRGVAKALNRPFAFISLGGTHDSSFLEGFDYTYEGSQCGRIIQILKESCCMNPVIYFDELDKVSETDRGMEIYNFLCHLIDPAQNEHFHDRYYQGLDFDLSRAFFIFSFNDESKINPILRDRIKIIHMKGFTLSQKISLTHEFLIPELLEEFKFPKDDIIFNNQIISFIIQNYTKEEGVRSLKKHLGTIISKLNIARLVPPDDTMLMKEIINEKIEFPITINTQIVSKWLDNLTSTSYMHLYT